MLLPHSLRDWLPEDHLAHFVSETIDALDLSAFYKRYEGGGARNQPFHPAMMFKVLIYAYATGVFSSRKIARKLHEDVALRVRRLATSPSTARSASFAPCISMSWLRCYCRRSSWRASTGLVKLGTIAVDGTELRANASKHEAMSYERMQAAEVQLKAQVDAFVGARSPG